MRLGSTKSWLAVVVCCFARLVCGQEAKRFTGVLSLDVPAIGTDSSVVYDYPIVYVRAPRKNADGRAKWAEVGDPRSMEPGAPLMLLQPDGTEEVLVSVTERESIADPAVSFDGEWIYYAKMHDALGHQGADLYKIHVPTRKVVQLTQQQFTPNTGVAEWSQSQLPRLGVYNLGPCPLPGGRLAFVSDRNAYKAANPGYAPNALALQLFVMNDDGSNVDCIGHLNLGMALHPVVLKDGRIMFSSLESQGLRSHHLWGVWSIHPDGTRWGPLLSAFEIGNGTADSTHFQTQLSDGSIVAESYYNLNNFGFGTYLKFPISVPDGYPAFGPGYKPHERNAKVRHGRQSDGRPIYIQFPFSPHGMESLTPFVLKGDWPSQPSDPKDNNSPRLGKFTHPAAAPDNHLLTAYSAGSLNSFTRYRPAFDSGIYLIKSGVPIDEPAQMRLIKNDPNYHEQWPRALVPYRRIYGIDEPARLEPIANDGRQSPHLPAGSPFGLVGTSSLYKRESYPYGAVPPGKVTAEYAGEKDRTGYKGFDTSHNWTVQGSDAGLYSNDDIHAIRIVALEPTSDVKGRGRTYYNHAKERMRILGEVPVRKFAGDKQPLDPDGNPDTSFLLKVPADMAWTFQTLDKDGMVLNSAQTWHQVRAGEIRTDCGGCHAHSQPPTRFEDTAAARMGYSVFDLTQRTPLLTSKQLDETKNKWDAADESGLRHEAGVKNVEYHRDIKPILARSCVACHTQESNAPAGNLVLDADEIVKAKNPSGLGFDIHLPASYARLAADAKGQWGHKPWHRHGWRGESASRYVTMMQSRRSLLIWKVYGKRLDGWQNEDMPYEATPGDVKSMTHHGEPVEPSSQVLETAHMAYLGSRMPPPEAVKAGKVQPLSDEDRRTLVRWIDLGCPIDLQSAGDPEGRSGWFVDDQRPTLTLTLIQAGEDQAPARILIGMHDYGSGLDQASFQVKTNVEIAGIAANENLAARFKSAGAGVWELPLGPSLATLKTARISDEIKDRQGNTSRLERTMALGN